jgi:hypothetical protein
LIAVKGGQIANGGAVEQDTDPLFISNFSIIPANGRHFSIRIVN